MTKKILLILGLAALIAGVFYVFRKQNSSPTPNSLAKDSLQAIITVGTKNDCARLSDATDLARCTFYFDQQSAKNQLTPDQQLAQEKAAQALQEAIASNDPKSCDSIQDSASKTRCQFYYSQKK